MIRLIAVKTVQVFDLRGQRSKHIAKGRRQQLIIIIGSITIFYYYLYFIIIVIHIKVVIPE